MASPTAAVTDPCLLRLRRATHAQHERLEAELDLMSPTLDERRYVAVLSMFLPIYRHLEGRLDDVLRDTSVECDLAWPTRHKVHLLEADLAELGFAHTVDALVPDVQVTNTAEALGVLYVLEGATLGGQYIGPHVASVLGTEAVRFFDAYGDERAAKWKQFRDVLRATTEDQPEMYADVEGAASATFNAFRSAYARRQTIEENS